MEKENQQQLLLLCAWLHIHVDLKLVSGSKEQYFVTVFECQTNNNA